MVFMRLARAFASVGVRAHLRGVPASYMRVKLPEAAPTLTHTMRQVVRRIGSGKDQRKNEGHDSTSRKQSETFDADRNTASATKGPAPDEFYEESTESETELFEMVTVYDEDKDFTGLTALEGPTVSKQQNIENDFGNVDPKKLRDLLKKLEENDDDDEEEFNGDSLHFNDSDGELFASAAQLEKLEKQLVEPGDSDNLDASSLTRDVENGGMEEGQVDLRVYHPAEGIDRNFRLRQEDVREDELNLMNKHDLKKYGPDELGSRPCPGKRQRTATRSLRCHLIDLETLHHANMYELRRFLSEDGMILSRKDNGGLCSKCQRKIATTIKRARHLGFLPHIGNFVLSDKKLSSNTYHEKLDHSEGEVIVSKTI